MGDPVVVAHVFGQMSHGGAEARTVQMLEHLDPSAVRLVFLTLEAEPGNYDEEIRSRGGEVIPVPMSLGLLWPWRLRQVARREGITVLHSHVATASGAFLAAAWLVGIPRRIAHFRSDGDGKGDSPRRVAQRGVMRWLVKRFATDVVAVSPAALEFAGRLDGTRPRTAVMASGLDTDRIRRVLDESRELPERPKGRLLVHVGRPNPDKNRRLAVEVLRNARTRGLDVSLALVGPTEPEEITGYQRRLGPHSRRLLVLGERDDVPAVLAAADVALMTSTLEGLPGVVLEAAAVGTPCVASDLPGVRWIDDELPGTVRMVSLDEPVETWVDEIARALETPRADVDKSLRRVEESVFAMPQAVAAFERLWTGR